MNFPPLIEPDFLELGLENEATPRSYVDFHSDCQMFLNSMILVQILLL